jgi:glycosyltransferase involved in cell wall biosynthesis
VSRVHLYLTYPFVLSWSMIEAMSAGCTILASDTAPVREVISDSRNGLLTDFFDAPALAARAAEVLAKPEDFADLGRAARATVEARYRVEEGCRAWIAQMERLAGRGGGSA